MIAELHPAGAEGAEAPLDLGYRCVVVLLEQPERLLRHAVHIAGKLVVGVAEGDRVPVDKSVSVGARKLVLVRQSGPAEPAGLDPGAGEMAGRNVIVVQQLSTKVFQLTGSSHFIGPKACMPPSRRLNT